MWVYKSDVTSVLCKKKKMKTKIVSLESLFILAIGF